MSDPASNSPFLRRATAALFLLAVAGVLLRLFFFGISVSTLQPSSDESVLMLLAQQIRAGDLPLLFLAQPYLFPIESFAIAPLLPFLPDNAAGARMLPFLLHAATLGLLLRLLFRQTDSPHGRLVGAALLLLPSSYVLMIQSAYSMPGYAALLFGGALLLTCADHTARASRGWVWMLVHGIAAGLCFSSHQLIVVFALPALLLALRLTPRGALLERAGVYAVGLSAGLAPYLLARWRFPGAHQSVESLASLTEIPKRLFDMALPYTLPDILGWRVVPFPGTDALPGPFDGVRLLVVALIAALLLAQFAKSARRVVRGSIGLSDAWLAVLIQNLLAFSASTRADSTSYRYLLPAALAVPFLLGDLAGGRRGLRVAIYAVAAALLALNTWSSARLIREWRTPDFAHQRAGVPDLAPALEWLRENGIRHTVASYGVAYRIAFQSGREIASAQPYNERFPHWPYPFLEDVWAGPRIAYVLNDRTRGLRARTFERHQRDMGVRCSVATAGVFRIFHNFIPDPPRPDGTRLSPARLTVDASPGRTDVALANDGQAHSVWTTTNTMNGSEWMTATWDAPEPLNRVVLWHGVFTDDTPSKYRVWLRRNGAWTLAREAERGGLDKFEIARGHPRYGRATRSFHFLGEIADGVRIEIAVPRTHRNWTVGEIEVYVQDVPAGT